MIDDLQAYLLACGGAEDAEDYCTNIQDERNSGTVGNADVGGRNE